MSTADITFLHELEAIINLRIATPTDGSYTAQLAAAGAKRIAQKVGEEGVEVALAAVSGTRNELVDESADLLYHLILLLAVNDLDLDTVCQELAARHTKAQQLRPQPI